MMLGDAVMATEARSTSAAEAVTGARADPNEKARRLKISTKPAPFDTVVCAFIVIKWL